MDSQRLQIGYARWMVWLFALATPGFAVLLIAATWSIASEAREPTWTIVLWLAVMWVIFLGLLIVPESWYLVRMWRGIPALQIDARGLLWGDDWERDVGVEWREVARIRSRPLRSRYYSDRLLLVEPTDPAIPRRFSWLARAIAWTSREIYGTPFVITLGTLRIQRDELIAAIRQRYHGVVDLTEIS